MNEKVKHITIRYFITLIIGLSFLNAMAQQPPGWPRTVASVQALTTAINDANNISVATAPALTIIIDSGVFTITTGSQNGHAYTLRAGLSIIGSVDASGNPATRLNIPGLGFLINGAVGADTNTLQNLIVVRNQIATGGNASGGFVNATGANTKVRIENCMITTSAGGNGGAVFADNGANIRINNSNFTGCQVGTNGGAIFANNGANVAVNNSNFTNCIAGTGGGAIYANSSNTTNTVVRVNNSNLSGCQARNGGVFHITHCNTRFYLDNSRMFNNTATGSGAVFYMNCATVYVVGCDIYDNVVGQGSEGGAVFMTNNSTMNMSHTSIVGNVATKGGAGFFLEGSNTLILSHVTMVGNVNVGNGSGGISAEAPVHIEISNSVITGNESTSDKFGDDLPDNVNINIENSIVGEDYVVDSNTTIPGVIGPGDVVVGDSGQVIVSIPTQIEDSNGNIITIPIPTDPDGNPTIGAGNNNHAQLNPVSVTVTVSDSIVCAGESIIFTAHAVNLTHSQVQGNNIEFRLVKRHNTQDTLIESKFVHVNIGMAEFTITTQTPGFELYIVQVRYNTEDYDGDSGHRQVVSNERFLIIIPQPRTEKIDHRQNVAPPEN